MGTSVFAKLRISCLLMLGTALVLCFVDATPASAFPQTLTNWEMMYGLTPGGADCQLCHLTTGEPWNGYGWDIRDALGNLVCDGADDSTPDGDVNDFEAFACVEDLNSDEDPGNFSNWEEITGFSTQPGWTDGPNTTYNRNGSTQTDPPPEGIGAYDPDGAGGGGGGGTGGGGGEGGGGGGDCRPSGDTIPPGQFKRGTIVVKPGQSIQEAIDRAQEGTRIKVLAGVYEEPCNPTNGLNISKNGIRLVGQSNKNKRVIIKSTGGQRNGIVIAPPEVTDCMSCHEDMAPPFPLLPGVQPGLPDPMPLLYDIEVSGITIEGFRNNGLFTERVSDFLIDDVASINNKGYGIFPVLSRNGVITNSYATGSHDSGIWIETSENVVATNNLVEGNVNGFEVSNSDNILIMDNEARGNTVGVAILLLPDIFDDRPGATHIDVVNNWIHDNNKENTAPGGILAELPAGIGILYLGVDDSLIAGNLVENNHFTGIAIADYCAVVIGIPEERFWCGIDPDTQDPGFLLDQTAKNNRVEGNILRNNADDGPPPPFGDFAADLTLLTLPADLVLPSPPFPPLPFPPEDLAPYHGNCYVDNATLSEREYFSLFDATIGNPPPWTPPACE